MANKTKQVETPYEAKYTIEELAEASKAFDTHKVIVIAALRSAGQDAYTMKEATKIITTFKSKEVTN